MVLTVLLLFSASAQTDTGSKLFDCALLLTLETYYDPENGSYYYYYYYGHDCCIEIIAIIVIMEVIVMFQMIDLIEFI